MSAIELLELIEKLPADKQKEVEELVYELTSEIKTRGLERNTSFSERGKKGTMKFGDLKGFVKSISDDFDEPLDDFKDYM